MNTKANPNASAGSFAKIPLQWALIVSLTLTVACRLCAQTTGEVATLEIQADKVKGQVSPLLYGLMTEEINYSYDGGLYGELIRNRTFRYNAQEPRYWRRISIRNS